MRVARRASTALQGSRGPAAHAGATGATGPAGQTASRSVTRTTSAWHRERGDGDRPRAAHDGGGDAQITTTYSARIMASASVQITNPDAAAREGRCVLRISDGTGPDNGLGDTSQAYAFDFPAQSDYDVTASLQRAVSKPAGTYNVRVSCWETGGLPADRRPGKPVRLRLGRLGPADSRRPKLRRGSPLSSSMHFVLARREGTGTMDGAGASGSPIPRSQGGITTC